MWVDFHSVLYQQSSTRYKDSFLKASPNPPHMIPIEFHLITWVIIFYFLLGLELHLLWRLVSHTHDFGMPCFTWSWSLTSWYSFFSPQWSNKFPQTQGNLMYVLTFFMSCLYSLGPNSNLRISCHWHGFFSALQRLCAQLVYIKPHIALI